MSRICLDLSKYSGLHPEDFESIKNFIIGTVSVFSLNNDKISFKIDEVKDENNLECVFVLINFGNPILTITNDIFKKMNILSGDNNWSVSINPKGEIILKFKLISVKNNLKTIGFQTFIVTIKEATQEVNFKKNKNEDF